MSSRFDEEQWSKIRATLDKDPTLYGIPQREYGSVVLASFNIRKLGAIDKRRQETWVVLQPSVKIERGFSTRFEAARKLAATLQREHLHRLPRPPCGQSVIR